MAQQFSDQVENVPGYGLVMDKWNDMAEEHLQTKDPFFVKDENGEETRRKAPPGLTKDERRIWKHVIDKAWRHDRSFCGCYWADIGLGTAPLAALVPIIGPIFMYAVHSRLVTVAEQARIPAKLQAKMSANITFDFLVSLVPVIGAVFEFMNQCSTRNAALLDTWMTKKGERSMRELGPFERVEEERRDFNARGVGNQVSGEIV